MTDFYQQPQLPTVPPGQRPSGPAAQTPPTQVPPVPAVEPPPTNRKKIIIIAALVLLLIAAIAAGAIFFASQKKPKPPPAITLNVYPQEILPTYPGATATRQVGLPQDGKQGINVALLTTDPLIKINDFYQKFLKENNWQFETSQYGEDKDQLFQLTFKKDQAEGKIDISYWPENKKYSEIIILMTY